ncbi:MAG: Bacterial antitoxin of type system, VapB [Thermoleophilia bacterium]|nr:Bacterial antitoxin of type system, VapB [Thermoleophilia bacterium]
MAARRTTMNIDHDLVAQAQEVLGTENATATVHAALDDVIRRFHVERLLEWDFNGVTNDEIEAAELARIERKRSVGRPPDVGVS